MFSQYDGTIEIKHLHNNANSFFPSYAYVDEKSIDDMDIAYQDNN